MNNNYSIEHNNEIFNVILVLYSFKIHGSIKELTIGFTHFGHGYLYYWQSTPSLGLGWLHKDKTCVYDPYKKTGNDYNMMEVARKLSLEIKKQL